MNHKKAIRAISIVLIIITSTNISASQKGNERDDIREQIVRRSSPAIQDARAYACILSLAGVFSIAHGTATYFSANKIFCDTMAEKKIMKRQALTPLGIGFMLMCPAAVLVYDLERKVSIQIQERERIDNMS